MKKTVLLCAFSFIILSACSATNPIMKNKGTFQGVIVVVPTPLTIHQDVDSAGLAHLINYYIEAGCNGILLLGSGGEYPYFTVREKKEIVTAGVRAARGRVPVMVGCGYYGFGDLEAFIRETSSVKVDAYLVALPTYYSVKPDDVIAYYSIIRSLTSVPVLYYHFPQMTGLALTVKEWNAIFSLPGIAGIKDSALNIPKMRKLMLAVPPEKQFSYFSGLGVLLVDTIDMGGAGVIDPLASVAPRLVVSCYTALKKGDRNRAEKLQKEINDLLPLMGSFTTPASIQKSGFKVLTKIPFFSISGKNPRLAVIKETLRQLGHPITAVVKSPLPQITDEEKTAVSKFIRENSLKKFEKD